MTVTALNLPTGYPTGLYDRDTDKRETSAISSDEVLSEEKQIRKELKYETPYGVVKVEFQGYMPTWIFEVVQEVLSLLWLPKDWYSYGSNKVSFDIAKNVIQFLPSILLDQLPKPLVGPTSEGGIQIEWHNNGIDLESEFVINDKISVLHVENEIYTEWVQDIFSLPDEEDRLNEIMKRLENVSS